MEIKYATFCHNEMARADIEYFIGSLGVFSSANFDIVPSGYSHVECEN